MDLDRVQEHATDWLDGTRFEEVERFGSGEDIVIVLRNTTHGG